MRPVATIGRSDEMVAYQRAQKAAVIAAVKKAVSAIEADINAANGSVHGVKICRAEVCRRAGIGQSTLKNPSHFDTRAFVAKELARLKVLSKRGRRQAPAETQAVDPRANTIKNLAIQLDAAMRHIDALRAELKQTQLSLEALKIKSESEQGSAAKAA